MTFKKFIFYKLVLYNATLIDPINMLFLTLFFTLKKQQVRVATDCENVNKLKSFVVVNFN